MSDAYDPGREGAKMSMAEAMSYGDYLNLDALLDQQSPLSDAHDELLFIIQHHTSELWMKLILHEMQAAREALIARDLPPMFKMLARVSRIFEQLNNQWDILRTMTPSDYTTFREVLGPSSGFQSYQYRLIEYVLGNRNPNLLKPHAHVPEVHEQLKKEIERPSLYDEAVRFLFETLDGDDRNLPAPQLDHPHEAVEAIQEIGRASCRERVSPYV